MKKTWTDDPITPESYPPQTNALIANWFVTAPESWQNKLKMEWMGSGGAMNFTCLATISSSAGDVGMAAGIATDPETEYTVTFNTDNGNAGTLTARIIHYNNSSHTTYTLLREISISRSSQNHISFTATADSVWLWVGHKANGTNLAAGTNFKVTSGSMLRYTWSVAQSHIQSYLYNYGAYRFAYNGQERTDEKAGKGNFYTAKFWEYGSRTGDRELPDPVFTPGWSPYAVFNGNPIWFNDWLGNYATGSTKDFYAAKKNIDKTVSSFDRKINKALEKGNVKRLRKLEAKAQPWKEMQQDFDNIINSDVEFHFVAKDRIETSSENLSGGHTEYNFDKDRVDITYFEGNEHTVVHEASHAAGYLKREWTQYMDNTGAVHSLGYDYNDEYKGYYKELIYNPGKFSKNYENQSIDQLIRRASYISQGIIINATSALNKINIKVTSEDIQRIRQAGYKVAIPPLK